MFTSINCYTLFDITDTGIRSHIRSVKFPMKDKRGNQISNEKEWDCSRNQQRNWETLLQVISLRTQPLRIIGPRKVSVAWKNSEERVYAWKFTFESEHDGVFDDGNAKLGHLIDDANGVPMIVGLTEYVKLTPQIMTKNNLVNTYFEVNFG